MLVFSFPKKIASTPSDDIINGPPLYVRKSGIP